MNLIDIRNKLEHCWNINTTTTPNNWNTNERVKGQDAVTSLLLQDLMGGRIIYGPVITPEGKKLSHFWNDIGGLDIDLTWHQFPPRSSIGETTPVWREAILSDKDIAHKYEVLKCAYHYLATEEQSSQN